MGEQNRLDEAACDGFQLAVMLLRSLKVFVPHTDLLHHLENVARGRESGVPPDTLDTAGREIITEENRRIAEMVFRNLILTSRHQ